jgi:LCP family protein required for cell wall assembly
VIIAAATVLFAALSAGLALVIVSRIDNIFFPGRQFTLPGPVGQAIPGFDDAGASGGNDPVNILVLGLDRRPQEGDEPTRTDTLFILRADPTTDSAAILGIPRDLIVDIPSEDGTFTYEDRINTVYVAGELNGYSGGGVGLLKDVLEEEPFNIKIDKHVIVDFEGFEELIDALGGIDVDVPEAVYDPYYSWTELPGDYDPQEFEPGRQHMDGLEALAYSRIRFSSDDLDRIQRQQRVIFAAIDKAKSLNVLRNPADLWDKYNDTIETDISDPLIPGYADLANQVKDNLFAVSLGSCVAPYTTPQGAAVLIGDGECMTRIVANIFTPSTLAEIEPLPEATPAAVRVEIQNGAGVEGLARDVMLYLVGKNLREDDLNATNAGDGQTHERSEIIDIDGTHEKNAFLLSDWLGIPLSNVRNATDDERAAMEAAGTAIIVILGTDEDFSGLIQAASGDTTGG